MVWNFPKRRYKSVRIDKTTSTSVLVRDSLITIIWGKHQKELILGSLGSGWIDKETRRWGTFKKLSFHRSKRPDYVGKYWQLVASPLYITMYHHEA